MKPCEPMPAEVFEAQIAAFDELAHEIEQATTIALCAHTNPDGDALGSVLGLARIIQHRWPGKRVACLLADPDPVPRLYCFLPGADTFIHVDEYVEDPDLFIMVDLPHPSRLNEARSLAEQAHHLAVIDHHPQVDKVAEVSVIRPEAAATGVIVAEFALHLGLELDEDLSQCLMCAIVTDTGRFQYQNADAEAFEIASVLVNAGADPSEISLHVYQSFRLEYLHLQSIVMGRIITFDEGRVAYSYATHADLERTGAHPDECDGLIDIVRSVEGSEVALFLKEAGDGTVRGNLRSKADWDVSRVARALGGGGHKAAAGFTARGSIDEVLATALPLLRSLLDGSLS